MGWIMIFFCAVLIVLGVTFVIAKTFLAMIFGIALIGIAIYLFLGLRDVQEQERSVVEFFGKYFATLTPGLQWLLLGVMEIRATISVWEQEIPLFSDQPAKLDLKDGTITPEGAKVFVKLRSPDKDYRVNPQDTNEKPRSGAYRAIYMVPNWREFIEDRIENALRSYLNALTIDEVLVMAKGGFNLADREPDKGIPNSELDFIEKDLRIWGFDLLRITITDFELPREIVAARDQVQVRQRQAEAAQYEAEREAEETGGAVIQMFCKMTGMARPDVEKVLKDNPGDFVKKYKSFWEKSWDTIYRRMGIDGKAYLDVRTQNPISDLIALWKKIPMPGGRGEKPEKRKGEKEKEGKED